MARYTIEQVEALSIDVQTAYDLVAALEEPLEEYGYLHDEEELTDAKAEELSDAIEEALAELNAHFPIDPVELVEAVAPSGTAHA